MSKAKPFSISKQVVVEAFRRVKAGKGAAGVDDQSIVDFEKDLKNNLYKIWNRMSSGSYFPPPVRRQEIPKADGSKRPMGIPTVGDCVAQTVAKIYFEPKIEPFFHQGSYACRPGKSAIEAVGAARQRCFRNAWVLDLDIKGFFDNINHGLMMRAVRRHTDCKWLVLYIQRWLKAPVRLTGGRLIHRDKGTPQGSVISPLLANLFLHYAFDSWMHKNYPHVLFERHADDIIVHCRSEKQSRWLVGIIRPKAAKTIRDIIRGWKIQCMSDKSIEDLAHMFNPVIRGWINYYGSYCKSALYPIYDRLNNALRKCAMRKYRRLHGKKRRTMHWLGRLAWRQPGLFAHWSVGAKPTVGR